MADDVPRFVNLFAVFAGREHVIARLGALVAPGEPPSPVISVAMPRMAAEQLRDALTEILEQSAQMNAPRSLQ